MGKAGGGGDEAQRAGATRGQLGVDPVGQALCRGRKERLDLGAPGALKQRFVLNTHGKVLI